ILAYGFDSKLLYPHSYFSLLFFQHSGPPLHLHSFPTRRSSDLDFFETMPPAPPRSPPARRRPGRGADSNSARCSGRYLNQHHVRSEEHTSELQSRFDLVCRLLLEKKKKPDYIDFYANNLDGQRT